MAPRQENSPTGKKQPTRVVVLGGGFGGIYAALEFEKALQHRDDLDVVLVNQDNFFLFTPMLHEVAASDLDATNIVNPIHKLLRKVRFFCGPVHAIDLKRKVVTVSHGDEPHYHELEYDHLVLGLGSVTHFYGLPGLEEHALTLKTIGDALYLRNRIVALFEEADFECCKHLRQKLLTFVVAGAGFAGVETIAAVNDFARNAIRSYPNLREADLRIVMVNSGKVLLPELNEKLGRYAGVLLESRGVEVLHGVRVSSYRGGIVALSDGTQIEASTLVWTAGNRPHPLLETLGCELDKGKLSVNSHMRLSGWDGVWALGDCAQIPDPSGKPYPPTAQHAMREARVLARNILAVVDGRPTRAFKFKTLGQLASLGRRSGVAEIFGFRFSGFIAWFLWRTIYLMKLPRLEKKVAVALDWTLDLFFSKDTVQIATLRSSHSAAPLVSGVIPRERHEESPGSLHPGSPATEARAL